MVLLQHKAAGVYESIALQKYSKASKDATELQQLIQDRLKEENSKDKPDQGIKEMLAYAIVTNDSTINHLKKREYEKAKKSAEMTRSTLTSANL